MDTKDRPLVSRGRVVGRWLVTFGVLAAATYGMYLVRGSLDKAHVTLVYLLIVLGSSAAGGRALGLTVAGVAFLLFDFFFLVPYLTFTIANPLDWLVLVAFLVTSVVAAQLLHRANATAEAATQRAIEVDRLASLGAETLNAADADEALRAIAGVIRQSTDVDECDIFLRGIDGRIALVASATRTAATEDRAEDQPSNAQHRATKQGSLVDWIVEHGMPAVELSDGTVRVAHGVPTGSGATTGPGVRALAMPLQVRDHTVGVLRIAGEVELTLGPDRARLLSALAYYAALGAERARLVATAERAEAERRVEALRSALLTAVSHDLRTPLTTIKGIANEILRGGDSSRAAVIESEADRLDDLVGGLLDLSRIHAGAVRPTLVVNTIDDLLGAALRRSAAALHGRSVEIMGPEDELLVGVFDFTHTLRIVVNLLDNAAKYSPAGSPIAVHVRREAAHLVIAVMDRGPGVAATERGRIFEPFYRPPGVPPDIRGHGLGLSIARGLAEAEGGSLTYEPRPGGGSVFTLTLPAAEALSMSVN
jgi:two-component system sensor histidine kinase KdpD